MAIAGEAFVCEKCGDMIAVIKTGGNPDIHEAARAAAKRAAAQCTNKIFLKKEGFIL